ncbi:hypothetical protein KH5_10360 [Urechidicola sp. KH5]
MNTKLASVLKQGGISLLLVLALYACEGSIEDVGVNIVDTDLFDTNGYDSEVISYNENIERRQSNAQSQYLLGAYSNQDFGKIDASIVSQLSYIGDIDFGLDPAIDTIIVDLPLYVSNQETNDDGLVEFELDSVFGNSEVPFKITVSELQTYLNTLDPEDPTMTKEYFSDDVYDFNPIPFYSDTISAKANDTILLVKRPEIIEIPEEGIYNVDTIRGLNNGPSIKIPLEEDFFTNNFLDNSSIFESQAAFLEFFNGLYLFAEVDPMAIGDSHIITLPLNQGSMVIYYTNSILTDETITTTDSDGNTTVVSETDLNGDGDFDDVDIPVRTKQSARFALSGVSNNKYIRDYSGSNAENPINNPDVINGDELLYVQGAAGSIGVVELFVNEDLDDLRSQNLLVNNAELIIYVDENANMDIIPDRLFLYNYETDEQIIDYFTEGFISVGGTPNLDEDGNATSYSLNITDYVSRVLANEDYIEPSKLGLKVLNPSDVPSDASIVDIPNYSWNPKGIILYGNQAMDSEKRMKLNITFTQLNQ